VAKEGLSPEEKADFLSKLSAYLQSQV